MELKQLKNRRDLTADSKVYKQCEKLNKILAELQLKELSDALIIDVNLKIEELNSFEGSHNELGKKVKKSQCAILLLLEKEAGIVTKNHYRRKWLAVGMAAFGIPMGAAFGAALGNMGFLGIGLPIGMGIGAAVGTKKDQEAAAKDKVLDIEI